MGSLPTGYRLPDYFTPGASDCNLGEVSLQPGCQPVLRPSLGSRIKAANRGLLLRVNDALGGGGDGLVMIPFVAF